MNCAAAIISGMGCVSAAGRNLAETLASFAAPHRNAGPTTLFETPIRCPVFEVPTPPANPAHRQSRTLLLARQAVREAVAQARLDSRPPSGPIGVCLGTTVACQLNDVDFYAALRAGAEPSLAPVDRFLKGNPAEAVAADLGADGPRLTVANACSSGTDAIGVALSWLNAGLCAAVIAGGADELNRIPLDGFHALGVMSPAPCRPFDRDRRGLNLGEGAGVLVLETPAGAAARGMPTRLRLCGYGAACDAYHLTAPRPDGSGLEAAIRVALAQAGIAPAAIAFVNAHGTATRDNDKVEGAVLGRVFGAEIVVLSTKGFTGHTLGAAGGLEAVFTAAALRAGWIPASAGFENRDDEIPIAPVAARTPVHGAYALSTSLAFGGNNAALVFGWEEQELL